MNLEERLDEAARLVRSRVPKALPDVAVVLGSGLGELAGRLEGAICVPYGEVPHMARCTNPFHAGRFVFGTLEGRPVAAMQGRFHGYEGYSSPEVVFPVRLLGRLGVGTLVVANAAGAVNESYAPGDLVAICDHVNLTGRNPVANVEAAALAERFFSMTDAYDPALRALLRRTADDLGIALREGVYAGLLGPSFETPAEIRFLHTIGCDLVGMSTVEEVVAARHLGMRVCGISLVSNMAAGIGGASPSVADLDEAATRHAERFCRLVASFVRAL